MHMNKMVAFSNGLAHARNSHFPVTNRHGDLIFINFGAQIILLDLKNLKRRCSGENDIAKADTNPLLEKANYGLEKMGNNVV